MWHRRIAAAAVALVLASAGAANAGASCAIPTTASQLATGLLASVNSVRSQMGLTQLRYNQDLAQAAQGHACDMAVNAFFDHHGSNGSNVGDRVRRAHYQPCRVAENLAWGAIYRAPEQVTQGWLNSPGHRTNMLHSGVREVGIGIAGTEREPYWVLVVANGC